MEDILNSLEHLKANKAQVTIKMSDGNVTSGRIDYYNRDAIYIVTSVYNDIDSCYGLSTDIIFLSGIVSINYHTTPTKKEQ